MRITDIRRPHVSKVHHSLADTPGAANRTIAAFSAIWNWTAAERDDLTLPPNPCKGIKRNPEEGRERFLSVDELARLGDALAEAETIGLPYDVDEYSPSIPTSSDGLKPGRYVCLMVTDSGEGMDKVTLERAYCQTRGLTIVMSRSRPSADTPCRDRAHGVGDRHPL